ncbi:hypothetical protein TELCIR_02125 [Teladorsagia circumcincta]|uniref:Uncharacterized protein n=1 Tax=Teladorsagia circumcincta TaxID=45464 RepID=A0A2G9V232_TELCI|nr:hypothetical protein TELCIR_02125 [Teladorsagia circumcincta]
MAASAPGSEKDGAFGSLRSSGSSTGFGCNGSVTNFPSSVYALATMGLAGPDVFPDAPTNLWQALFCDDKQLQIQKFYKEHYGPVWETARRREQEWKAIQSAKSANGDTNNNGK